jgi:hypothetical protein
VTQTRAGAGAAAIDGQLAINGRSREVAFVSGSATGGGTLRDGLARFTEARYGRDGAFDAARLDEAIADGLRVVEQLAEQHKPGLRERLWMR